MEFHGGENVLKIRWWSHPTVNILKPIELYIWNGRIARWISSIKLEKKKTENCGTEAESPSCFWHSQLWGHVLKHIVNAQLSSILLFFFLSSFIAPEIQALRPQWHQCWLCQTWAVLCLHDQVTCLRATVLSTSPCEQWTPLCRLRGLGGHWTGRGKNYFLPNDDCSGYRE